MGLAFIRDLSKDTQLGLWKVEESSSKLEQKLILNDEEKEFFKSLENNKRNYHWLGGRVLLRTMINTPEFIELQNDENGKPYLVNYGYEISLSHSFDYAAAMISKKCPVGVDIEKIRPKIRKIVRKFMHYKECDEAGTEAEIKKLFVYWCAKEAMFKLYGKKPLSIRENIRISPFTLEESGIVEGFFVDAPALPQKKYEVHYIEYDGYMLAYVMD